MAVGACQSFLPQCWCTFIAHGLVLQQAVMHALLGVVASAVARRNFILSHCYFGVAAHLHRSAGRESAAQTARSAAGLSGVPPCKVLQNIVQATQIRAPRSIKTSVAFDLVHYASMCNDRVRPKRWKPSSAGCPAPAWASATHRHRACASNNISCQTLLALRQKSNCYSSQAAGSSETCSTFMSAHLAAGCCATLL